MTSAVDVVVIGDGPAGSALAAACRRRGIDVALVGADEPWAATYGAWADELDDLALLRGHDVAGSRHPDVVAWTNRRHDLGRTYAVIDNDALRTVLRTDVAHRDGRVARVDAVPPHHVQLDSGETISCRLVVDAAGWPARFAAAAGRARPPAWQTAFGVVLSGPPPGSLGTPTFMDFRPPAGCASGPVTFAYSLPVADGWLVEETVLAARPAVEPDSLAARLAARLGRDVAGLRAAAIRTERVLIPMGGGRPGHGQPIVAFGAAAGYVNPTSGYSVVRSLELAPAVADAIADGLDGPPTELAGRVWDAVWPIAARRTRVLHDYGLDLLVRLDGDATRSFFETFFDLPAAVWSAYLRAGSSPAEVARVMAKLFSAAPWSVRRRLAAGNPAAFGRLLRPA